MSNPEPGSSLGRDEIIGKCIVEIRRKVLVDQNGIDYSYDWFILDSGVSIFLPFEDAGSLLYELPADDATAETDAQLEHVLGKKILRVVRDRPDQTFHWAPYLVLENGYAVSSILSDYHGTGYADIHLYRPGDLDIASKVEFFKD